MNDDLKAYVDGELPPDAAERLRTSLEDDPGMALQADDMRRLSAALRALPEPQPVGQAETLAALGRSRGPLLRGWGFALAGCAAVLLMATWISGDAGSRWNMAGWPNPNRVARPLAEATAPVEVEIPAARRNAFVRFVHERGGQVRPDGDAMRAFYESELQGELSRRFELPEGTPWTADGLRVRFVR